MNNYRSSYATYTQACDKAAELKRQGAIGVCIIGTGDGEYDVTWSMR
jgi:hypothetical protein